MSSRARLRDLGITIGHYPTGKYNAITDVPGVLVGHDTLIQDKPHLVRTGITMIMPRDGQIWENHAFAAYHTFNGNGEMAGAHWMEESGTLSSPIALTNTFQVGLVRDSITAYAHKYSLRGGYLPVAAETYDGWLSESDALHLTQSHVFDAINTAASGRVKEGNVGGGTGMICHDFKGGIGTSSRLVTVDGQQYTVGVLVQANYGDRPLLRLNGIPVGQYIDTQHTPAPWQEGPSIQSSSIIIIIGTDAPLVATQCKRLAQRATVGLARAGGVGHNFSGDIFLAFSTGNDLPFDMPTYVNLKMLRHQNLNPFFEAVAEATEESIWNALTMAETMTGQKGRTAHAIPLDVLQEVVQSAERV